MGGRPSTLSSATPLAQLSCGFAWEATPPDTPAVSQKAVLPHAQFQPRAAAGLSWAEAAPDALTPPSATMGFPRDGPGSGAIPHPFSMAARGSSWASAPRGPLSLPLVTGAHFPVPSPPPFPETRPAGRKRRLSDEERRDSKKASQQRWLQKKRCFVSSGLQEKSNPAPRRPLPRLLPSDLDAHHRGLLPTTLSSADQPAAFIPASVDCSTLGASIGVLDSSSTPAVTAAAPHLSSGYVAAVAATSMIAAVSNATVDMFPVRPVAALAAGVPVEVPTAPDALAATPTTASTKAAVPDEALIIVTAPADGGAGADSTISDVLPAAATTLSAGTALPADVIITDAAPGTVGMDAARKSWSSVSSVGPRAADVKGPAPSALNAMGAAPLAVDAAVATPASPYGAAATSRMVHEGAACSEVASAPFTYLDVVADTTTIQKVVAPTSSLPLMVAVGATAPRVACATGSVTEGRTGLEKGRGISGQPVTLAASFAASLGASADPLRAALARLPPVGFAEHARVVLHSLKEAKRMMTFELGPAADALALGGAASSVRRALGRDGAGFWVFAGGMPAAHTSALAQDISAMSPSRTTVVGNTSSAAEVVRMRGRGDTSQRQLALCESGIAHVEDVATRGAGKAASVLPGVRAGITSIIEFSRLPSGVLGMSYASVFHVLLCSLAGAPQQHAHTDVREWKRVGDAPRVLGAFLSFLPAFTLPMWPGPRLARGIASLDEPFVLPIPPGYIVVLRGDAILAKAANGSRLNHWRMHAYLVASTFVKRGTKTLDLDALLDTGVLCYRKK